MAPTRHQIDALRDDSGALDRPAILDILPYGDDFLFVDRVVRLDQQEIEATFRVPETAPYLDAHFRGLPIMPGALMCEGFAQAGSILVRYQRDNSTVEDMVGHHVESARYLHLVLPGDLLHLHARVLTAGKRSARIEGTASVGSRCAGRLRIVLGIFDRSVLEEQMARLQDP